MKSMGRRCSEMVPGDGDPDDRCQQLGEGETSDCIPTRRRWQKSSSKVTDYQTNKNNRSKSRDLLYVILIT